MLPVSLLSAGIGNMSLKVRRDHIVSSSEMKFPGLQRAADWIKMVG